MSTESAALKKLLTAIPVIRVPALLPNASPAVLASHPGTRLEGFAIKRHCIVDIISPAAFQTLIQHHAEFTWCVPFRELVVRLMPDITGLVAANDVARLVGIPSWYSEEQQVLLKGKRPVGQVDAKIRSALDRLEQIAMWAADLFNAAEKTCYQTHERINGRGIHVDLALAGWLDRAISLREQQREQALGTALGAKGLTVSEALKVGGVLDHILADEGLRLPGRAEEDLIRLIDHPNLSGWARSALAAILGHGRIVGGKVRRILSSVGRDSRLRDQFRIWGARTYRFTSSGVQLQNLPKPVRHTDFKTLVMSIPDDLDGPIDNRVNEALASAVPTQMVEDAFAAILRLCLTAKEGHCLVVLDWNAIEPRIRAWLSDDWEHLDRWRAGEDLYSHLIGTILNRKITKQDNPELRDVGKIADVGCGYQMGAVAFERFCQAYRMDLSHLGLTATDVVRAYRKRYHRLSACPNGLWSRLEGGALRALQSGEHMVGQVCFRRSSGGHLDVVLPNDSFRRYWHPTVLVRPPPWAKPGDDSHNRPTLFVARSPEEQPTNVMYGGRWLENICQSIGRELLMDLLNRAESRGFPCVAHCHDEGVFEVPEQGADSALRSLLEMAQEAPEWAAGLPLRAEGFICPFWSKSSIDWYRSNDH